LPKYQQEYHQKPSDFIGSNKTVLDFNYAPQLDYTMFTGIIWTALEGFLERAMGIEPTALAWEARVLPLYDARIV
jgi:hypothetical protein